MSNALMENCFGFAGCWESGAAVPDKKAVCVPAPADSRAADPFAFFVSLSRMLLIFNDARNKRLLLFQNNSLLTFLIATFISFEKKIKY
jgi:hypothetical protein